MPDAVICGYARTPFGKFRGALSSYSAVELGIKAVEELLSRTGIDPSLGAIDQVYMGQVLQAGAGQAPARQVALGCGMPNSTPCTTINKVCGSSLKAVMIAATEIRAGISELVVAGGMESMSNAPRFIRDARRGEDVPFKSLLSILSHDGLTDAYSGELMGSTGETCALEYGISRDESDAYSIRSHKLSAEGWENGEIGKECVSMEELSIDEGIRMDADMSTLISLKPVFSEDGQVTAGNVSQVSDGASAVLIASEETAIRMGLPILARIVDYTTSGVEPNRVMSAPIPAVEELLSRNKLNVEDVGLFEHNEAFASASCSIMKHFQIPESRFNVNGGAISIGHPLGATGTRCLMTLVNSMHRDGHDSGIVTICLGGGNAVAMLINSS
ncbi:MAG: thiolase family protein [Candidatus Thermoplasmatota archaeon]|nr:thiolase family protein [Candidatus Thermoplasmatota archaeon]